MLAGPAAVAGRKDAMTTMSRPRSGSDAIALDLCRAEVGAGYLWVQYRLAPVPDGVRSRPQVRDLIGGVASWDTAPLQHCRASYRVGLDGVHVDGILAVGPVSDRAVGTVRARFTPLPGVPGFDGELYELAAELAGGTVVRVGATAL